MEGIPLRVRLFCGAYYESFDRNRPSVLRFYSDAAEVSFRSLRVLGRDDIANLYGSLPPSQHEVTTLQDSVDPMGRIVILVMGMVFPLNQPRLIFSQTFFVRPADRGGFTIHETIYSTMAVPAPEAAPEAAPAPAALPGQMDEEEEESDANSISVASSEL